jgi:uncharacterized protein
MATRKENCIDFVEFPAKSVAGLTRSKRFFAEAFGWSYKDWGHNYADTTSSGLGSGLNADPGHRPSKPLVVIYTSDLDATRARVVTAGGKVTRDIFSFPGGRRFHFKDPSGNELAAWSDK